MSSATDPTRSAAARQRWARTDPADRAAATERARQVARTKQAASTTLLAAAVVAIEDAGGQITWP